VSDGSEAPARGDAPLERRPGADLLELVDLAAPELVELLQRAAAYVAGVVGHGPRGNDHLQGFTVLNLFQEPSTRTRASFELAARSLGATVVTFTGDASTSAAKGETVRDTVRNLDAMGLDVIVVRDKVDGLPRRMTQWARARVVNAGDGRNAHPTQGLLDALAVCEAVGARLDPSDPAPLRGRTIAICGDIDHGRVAHSDVQVFQALGATVRVAGPPPLLAEDTAARYGLAPFRDLDAALAGCDAIVMLRIQRERLGADIALPEPHRYHAQWGLTAERLERCAPRAWVLHPGPMNRGVEIADDVADGPRSRVLRQVTLGVAVRMAVLARACGRPLPLSPAATRTRG
jgi:aspartate carbamoyltransferase catalytic subunit